MAPSRSILSDQPAATDHLNFAPYAKTLADIIQDPTTATPLTIGVFGGWGRGKTSLMLMVQRELATPEADELSVQAVWFNAWLYSQQQSMWRALISRVLNATRSFTTLTAAAHDKLDRLEARLYGGAAAGAGQVTLRAEALAGLGEIALPPLLGLDILKRQAEAEQPDRAAGLDRLSAQIEAGEARTRRDQIAALDEFRQQFEAISSEFIDPHGRLAVFVDDLDRCLPDKAIEVLEAVKLFLDVPGCVFVLGVAREVIEEGVRIRYKDYDTPIDGAQYLEKIIQIPFSLPPIDEQAVKSYVHQIAGPNLPDARCETVFSVGLEPNPRRIKRTLNIFLLLWRLAQNRSDLKDAIKPVRLAKIVIIQQYHPDLFSLITQGPHYLIDLEQRFRIEEPTSEEKTQQRSYLSDLIDLLIQRFNLDELKLLCDDLDIEYEDLAGDTKSSKMTEFAQRLENEGRLPDMIRAAREERPNQDWPDPALFATHDGTITAGALSDFLDVSLLRALLTCTAPEEADANFADMDALGVREYIYLTRSTVEQKTAPVTSAAPPAVTPLEPQMVTIPAGKFWMGSSDGEVAELEQMRTDKDYRIWIRDETPHHEVDLAAYTIGRYPVTNAEFARFMEDGGYAKKEWWTESGWQARERGNWVKPRDWDDKQMSDPSQPVVGVSWYEAYAYCRWLAARTNAPYRLPTEAEWEKSARGKEGYRYPWGNHWEASRCNNSETGPGRTTPVGQYSPQGDSSYGVAEMVGQVWEWCSDRFSKYDELKGAFENPEGDEARIIRGGSWLNSSPAAVCRCAIRGKNSPVNRLNNWGFRVARSP